MDSINYKNSIKDRLTCVQSTLIENNLKTSLANSHFKLNNVTNKYEKPNLLRKDNKILDQINHSPMNKVKQNDIIVIEDEDCSSDSQADSIISDNSENLNDLKSFLPSSYVYTNNNINENSGISIASLNTLFTSESNKLCSKTNTSKLNVISSNTNKQRDNYIHDYFRSKSLLKTPPMNIVSNLTTNLPIINTLHSIKNSTKEVICLEESNSEESDNEKKDEASLNTNIFLNENLKTKNLLQTYFENQNEETNNVIKTEFRPMAQILYDIGKSLIETFPYNEPDMVHYISKCAAKCKEEINYDFFTESTKKYSEVNSKNKVPEKNHDEFTENKTDEITLETTKSYNLRNKSNNIIKIGIIETKSNTKNVVDIEIDNKNCNLDDDIQEITKLKDENNINAENSIDSKILLQHNILHNVDIEYLKLPKLNCQCGYNTTSKLILFEHYKHGVGYAQCNCCLCGYYTPVFTKYLLHMKTDHQILVNNRIFKVNDDLQCPMCKYEANNVPTINRHVKFCNSRYVTNILTPKADDNDIPVNIKLFLKSINCQPLDLNEPIIANSNSLIILSSTAPNIDNTSYVICPICQGTVRDNMDNHMKYVHNKVKDSKKKCFLCRQCVPMKVFNSKLTFDMHSISTHANYDNVGTKEQAVNIKAPVISIDNAAVNKTIINSIDKTNLEDSLEKLTDITTEESSDHLIVNVETKVIVNKKDQDSQRILDKASIINDLTNSDKVENSEKDSPNSDISLRIKEENMHSSRININSMVAGQRCDYCRFKFGDVSRLEYHILRAHHRHFPSHMLLWRLLYHRAIGNCFDADETMTISSSKMSHPCSLCDQVFEYNFLLYRHIFICHFSQHMVLCLWCRNNADTSTENYKNNRDDLSDIVRTEKSIKEFTKDSITNKLGTYIDLINAEDYDGEDNISTFCKENNMNSFSDENSKLFREILNLKNSKKQKLPINSMILNNGCKRSLNSSREDKQKIIKLDDSIKMDETILNIEPDGAKEKTNVDCKNIVSNVSESEQLTNLKHVEDSFVVEISDTSFS